MISAAPMMLHCRQCGRVNPERQGVLPRFCAVCGSPLDPTSGGGMIERGIGPTPPSATAALILGMLSFLPLMGIIFGVGAITMGAHAKRVIRASPRPLLGLGLANTGMVLGVITSLLWLLVCFGR